MKSLRLIVVVVLSLMVVGVAEAQNLVDGSQYELSGFLRVQKIEGGLKILLDLANQRFPKGSGLSVPKVGGITPFPFCPVVCQSIPLNAATPELRNELIALATARPNDLFVIEGKYFSVSAMVLGAYPGLRAESVSPFGRGQYSSKLPKRLRLFPVGSTKRFTLRCTYALPNDWASLSLREQNAASVKFAESFRQQITELRQRGFDIAFCNLVQSDDKINEPIQEFYVSGTAPALAAFVENPWIVRVEL